jgi:uncharacterized protein YndB with AHSA1/START domain
VNNLLYSVEREYPVAVETLWNAWVEADALEDWYHPTDLAVLPGSVAVDFEPRGDGAWVRFSQYGEMPAEQVPQTKAGMESYFDSLDEFLSRTAR